MIDLHQQTLKIVKGLSPELKESISSRQITLGFVDMAQWAWTTNGAYLFTHSAGPCLNLVVHNWSVMPCQRGALGHVHYFDTNDQRKLYDRASNLAFQMIQRCQAANTDHFEIWLGAGSGYHHTVPGQTNIVEPEGLVVYLTKFLREKGIGQQRFTISDTHFLGLLNGQTQSPQYDPGEIIYHPSSQQIVLLEQDDRIFVLQKCNTERDKAANLGTIPD